MCSYQSDLDKPDGALTAQTVYAYPQIENLTGYFGIYDLQLVIKQVDSFNQEHEQSFFLLPEEDGKTFLLKNSKKEPACNWKNDLEQFLNAVHYVDWKPELKVTERLAVIEMCPVRHVDTVLAEQQRHRKPLKQPFIRNISKLAEKITNER